MTKSYCSSAVPISPPQAAVRRFFRSTGLPEPSSTMTAGCCSCVIASPCPTGVLQPRRDRRRPIRPLPAGTAGHRSSRQRPDAQPPVLPAKRPRAGRTSLERMSRDPYADLPQVGSFSVTSSDFADGRSEEHTSELQSRRDLVCRLLLERKKAHHETPAGHLMAGDET